LIRLFTQIRLTAPDDAVSSPRTACGLLLIAFRGRCVVLLGVRSQAEPCEVFRRPRLKFMVRLISLLERRHALVLRHESVLEKFPRQHRTPEAPMAPRSEVTRQAVAIDRLGQVGELRRHHHGPRDEILRDPSALEAPIAGIALSLFNTVNLADDS